MRKQQPIEVRPSAGGHLITAPSPDAGGLANYLVKRDWRRVDDCEIRGEGYNYFRPNAGISLGRQPLFASGDILLVHEVKRVNRQKCVIVGTRTDLYRFYSQTGGGYYTSDYFESNAHYYDDDPGEWLLIGTGFSESGERWQAVDLNGYVILNNGVDLPVGYRVEDSGVKPLYELRELGIASVGVIFELENYLCAADVRQIQESSSSSTTNTQAIMGMLTSAEVTGTQNQAVSSSDAHVVGSIAASTTVITSTGDIFLLSQIGKTVRFLNQYSAEIVEYYGPRSVRVDVAPETDVTAMVFIITRPVIGGVGLASVYAGNTMEAVWEPGAVAPFEQGVGMAGDYYIYFLPNADYPFGWSSGISTVIDFKKVQLVKTPPKTIVLQPFRVVPSEFVMTLSAGTFTFSEEMAGESIVVGYKKRAIVSVADSTHAIMDTDYPFTGGMFAMTNPDAYAPFRGAVDGYGHRVLWSLAGKPERYGSNVGCEISANDNRLTLDWPMKSLKVGDEITIVGAGLDGGNLDSTIKMLCGNVALIKDVALTPVKKVGPITATTLTHVTTTATFTSATAHGFVSNQLVTIEGVTNKDDYNGAFTITVTGDTTFTYVMLADPGANATTIDGIKASSEAGLVKLSDSLSDSQRLEDLEDDGSTIIAVRKLNGIGVLFRETSIFLMSDSRQLDPPFAFSIVYGGSKGGDRDGALAFPHAVANVKDDYLLYPGENDFYRFDLVTKSPQIFTPLHSCRNLFFDAVERGDDVFSADNEVTREVWFCYPDSHAEDRVLRFDYTFGTASTSSARITAACTVNRPSTDGADIDEKWFVIGVGLHDPDIGVVGYYGRTSGKPIKSGSISGAQGGTTVTATGTIFKQEHVGRTIVFDTATGHVPAHITEYVSGTLVTVEPKQSVSVCSFTILPASWSRFGVEYDSDLQSSYLDFGINSREKRLTSYAPHLAEKYIGGTFGQSAESDLSTTVLEIKPGLWYRLGRVSVSNITGLVSYSYWMADLGDPFNTSAALAGQTNGYVEMFINVGFEVDTVNGLVRLIPGALPIVLSGGQFQILFDCAAITNAFNVQMFGGLSVAKGVTQLFSRNLTDLLSGDVIKTYYAKYLYQDRLKVSGSHNSARLSMRAFETHGVDSNQIGRQSKV